MENSTLSKLESYDAAEKLAKEEVASVIDLLEEVPQEFEGDSLQTRGDLTRGIMKVGSFYMPLSVGERNLYENHYPLIYIQNVQSLFSHINQTDSVVARWLLVRTLIETIYVYAGISLTANRRDIHVKRYRAFTILDFSLNVACTARTKKFVNEYFSLLISCKKREELAEKVVELFPQFRSTLFKDNTEGLRKKRVSYRSNQVKAEYLVPRPDAYDNIYDSSSRLMHGNPFHISQTTELKGPWNERMLLHGVIIKACEDLLNATLKYADLKDKGHIKELATKAQELQSFYATTLKPTWDNIAASTSRQR